MNRFWVRNSFAAVGGYSFGLCMTGAGLMVFIPSLLAFCVVQSIILNYFIPDEAR